jgi:selenocysteine-specific elongation factor
MPLTVGTAGHVDHGKTWLVRALTGTDTDRLPEERARGISIDLGYAQLTLPDGRALSLVDVPGHERFVRNMVAGTTGIDLFLLVVDAGEGPKPQTIEHVAILRLLGIERGVVAVTKADAVDDATLAEAVARTAELLPGVEIVPVSALTGAGLDELRAALGRAAAAVDPRPVDGPTRLYVDRIFTLRGIGTVVTGTLSAGSIGVGDALRVEPAGIEVRARSVQVHDRPTDRAEAGQRVAVNLPGIEPARLARGDALVAAGRYPVTYRLDVRLDPEAREPPTAVTVHIGSADRAARVVRAGPYAQLRLTRPVVAARGDRVILRTSTTVGGGVVVDPLPPRRVDVERLRLLDRGDPAEILRATVHEPVSVDQLAARGLLAPEQIAAASGAVERAGDFLFARAWLDGLRSQAHARLAERAAAHPLDPGIPVAELLPREPWAAALLPLLGVERDGGLAFLPGQAASFDAHAGEADRLEREVREMEIVKLDDRELGAALEREGRLRRVGDGLAVSVELYERGLAIVRERAPVSLPDFRDAMGISRRTAQLLLERYDGDGVTRRVGDVRVVRRV